jgi:hypothetical protein
MAHGNLRAEEMVHVFVTHETSIHDICRQRGKGLWIVTRTQLRQVSISG